MATQTIHIALPGGASATIEYLPAEPPPAEGYDWPTEIDWPGVTATLYLPAIMVRQAKYGDRLALDPALRCDRRIWAYRMDGEWGAPSGDAAVYVQRHCRAATMVAAVAHARQHIADAGVVLAEIVGARAARLRQREATIAAAHDGSGWEAP